MDSGIHRAGHTQDFHYHSDFSTNGFSQGDPAAWREHTWERILPAGSAPGKWGLSAMSIKDKAGNAIIYGVVFHRDLPLRDRESVPAMLENVAVVDSCM